jgi:hypothetical protein
MICILEELGSNLGRDINHTDKFFVVFLSTVRRIRDQGHLHLNRFKLTQARVKVFRERGQTECRILLHLLFQLPKIMYEYTDIYLMTSSNTDDTNKEKLSGFLEKELHV